jgi:hypothetical protein
VLFFSLTEPYTKCQSTHFVYTTAKIISNTVKICTLFLVTKRKRKFKQKSDEIILCGLLNDNCCLKNKTKIIPNTRGTQNNFDSTKFGLPCIHRRWVIDFDIYLYFRVRNIIRIWGKKRKSSECDGSTFFCARRKEKILKWHKILTHPKISVSIETLRKNNDFSETKNENPPRASSF